MESEPLPSEGSMDTELAAVEDDVERKRVGKNPFDEKFTSLVRILHATGARIWY